MNGKYLLDTNIVIAIFAGDSNVLRQLNKSENIFVSSITIGELCFGAYKSMRSEDNLARIEKFAKSNDVLSCDLETASIYGRIKNKLRQKGHPIPENDIWIAAVAQQHALTLVSRDLHFVAIDDLVTSVW
ncbi:MAG: type II toxin-antitoxin system VapC family toxin [Anaerolineae bacterium]|nr:type II toxin-antitoxin system VapC family toxin [Anaerolineae bacterium]